MASAPKTSASSLPPALTRGSTPRPHNKPPAATRRRGRPREGAIPFPGQPPSLPGRARPPHRSPKAPCGAEPPPSTPPPYRACGRGPQGSAEEHGGGRPGAPSPPSLSLRPALALGAASAGPPRACARPRAPPEEREPALTGLRGEGKKKRRNKRKNGGVVRPGCLCCKL